MSVEIKQEPPSALAAAVAQDPTTTSDIAPLVATAAVAKKPLTIYELSPSRRKEEAEKSIKKHPDRVPVMIHRLKGSLIGDIDEAKRTLTIARDGRAVVAAASHLRRELELAKVGKRAAEAAIAEAVAKSATAKPTQAELDQIAKAASDKAISDATAQAKLLRATSGPSASAETAHKEAIVWYYLLFDTPRSTDMVIESASLKDKAGIGGKTIDRHTMTLLSVHQLTKMLPRNPEDGFVHLAYSGENAFG